MKLSTRTRYGVRMMALLALNQGERPVLLRQIAERENISEKYLSQIVLPLRSAAMVRSVRGAHGGYILGREPKEITLRELVEVLEGGLDIVEGSSSTTAVGTAIQGMWQELTEGVGELFAAITLQDIVSRIREVGESPVMYNI